MSKISVIVPVYNVEQYLPQCLDSIINQTYKNLEIICVDDGSPDNSGKILDEYAKKDKRIKVIHQENQGVSVARNTGLDNATGEYIGFVDPDDWIEANYYETLIHSAKENNADVVQCGYKTYCDKIDKVVVWKKTIATNFKNIIKNLKRGYVWNKLWKAELIQKNNLRFYPGIYMEDLLLSIKSANHMSLFSIISYAGYCYRIRNNSSTNDISKKQKIKNDRYTCCLEAIAYAKECRRTTNEINVMNIFLIKQLLSAYDLRCNDEYKRYKKLFGFFIFLLYRRILSLCKYII